MESKIGNATEFKLEGRVRSDMGKGEEGIAALANSLEKFGQFHNIIVEGNLVRVGGRRWLACMFLASKGRAIGGTRPEGDPRRFAPGQIRYVQWGSLTPSERAEIEREENYRRKGFNAGEDALAIQRIRDAMHEDLGRAPTKAELSEASGKSVGQVSMGLHVAKRIVEGHTELSQAKSVAGAYRQSKAADKRKAVIKRLADVKPMDRTLAERLTQGDALELIKQFEPGFFDFINFDPPWGIGIDDYTRNDKHENFDDDPAIWEKFIIPIIPELWRVLKQDSFMVCWFGAQFQEKLRTALQTLGGTVRPNAGFQVRPVPNIWYKNNKGGATSDPSQIEMNVYEPYFVAMKGEPRLFCGARTNVLSYPLPPQAVRIHPTQKDVGVMHDILERYTYGNMRIYDPTFGSGALFIPARKLGRQFWGHDLSQNNVDAAIHWLRADEIGGTVADGKKTISGGKVTAK